MPRPGLRVLADGEDLLRLALQIAVLRAVADLDLRRVITFHSRIQAGRAFAGEDGEECGILANSGLLSEGIDIPAVDAIVFADPKSSIIDIVQAIGRALRQSYRQGKVSWVIIPVYLPSPLIGDDTATADPAEIREAGPAVKAEADAEIEATSFRTIWRVLRALAAHDARMVGRITELRTHRHQTEPHTAPTEAQAGEGIEAGPAEGEATWESSIEWLRIDAWHHARQILQTVELRAFNPRVTEWQRMHAQAVAFHIEHGHLDPHDKTEQHAELVSWFDRQRHLSASGLLDPARISELDALGMIWSKSSRR